MQLCHWARVRSWVGVRKDTGRSTNTMGNSEHQKWKSMDPFCHCLCARSVEWQRPGGHLNSKKDKCLPMELDGSTLWWDFQRKLWRYHLHRSEKASPLLQQVQLFIVDCCLMTCIPRIGKQFRTKQAVSCDTVLWWSLLWKVQAFWTLKQLVWRTEKGTEKGEDRSRKTHYTSFGSSEQVIEPFVPMWPLEKFSWEISEGTVWIPSGV